MYLHATTAHNSSVRYCAPPCAAWPEKLCVGGGGGEDLIFNLHLKMDIHIWMCCMFCYSYVWMRIYKLFLISEIRGPCFNLLLSKQKAWRISGKT